MDRVTQMLWRQGTSAPFGSWSYGHNNRGQRTSSTDITGRAATYGYDDASRLISETITSDPRGASFNGALSYGIDGAGNRLTRTSTLAALAAQSFSYDANDQLATETYDANGNTLTSGGHSFAYDFENRLVSKDGGAVTITYDCDGNRVAETVGGFTTRYLVDNLNPTGYLQVLEEIVGGTVQTRYTYGTSLVSQTRDASTSPATSFYGRDAHGNIVFLTDTTGAVTASYDYDAWGSVIAQTGSTPNTRLYTGEEFDADLGLINLRARQYSPRTGRFLTLDPLDTTGSARASSWRAQVMNAIAAHNPPHIRATFELGALSGVPLSSRLLTPLSLKRYLYGVSDPVEFMDPSGQNEFAEDAPFEAAAAANRALIVKTALRIGAVFLAASLIDIMPYIKKGFAGGDPEEPDYSKHPDFEKCWLAVKEFLMKALAKYDLVLMGPEIQEVQSILEEAEEILKACLIPSGGGN